jgi:hypothetical protein
MSMRHSVGMACSEERAFSYLALDHQQHLIHVPLVAEPRTTPTELVSVLLATRAAPLPYRLIVTITPRSKSDSSTSRKLKQKRKYGHTAWLMLSVGKLWFL